jgi:hypothetical protein
MAGQKVGWLMRAAAAVVMLMVSVAVPAEARSGTVPPNESVSGGAGITGLVPVGPARLADTRPAPEGKTIDGLVEGVGAVAAGGVLQVPVLGRGGLPTAGVGAVMLNVTAVEPVGPGFLTVFPCGADRPLAANVNYVAGQVVPNAVLAKVGDAGSVCVYSLVAAHVVVDVDGWAASGSAMTSIQPARLADTRQTIDSRTIDGQVQGFGRIGAGAVLTLPVLGRGGIPSSGVEAVVLNVTAVDPTKPGFLTVYPCGSDRPLAANVNYVAHQVVPNAVFAEVGAGGAVCIYTLAATHLVVDVAAWTRSRPPDGAVTQLADLSAGVSSDRYPFDSSYSRAEDALVYRTAQGAVGVASVDENAHTVVVHRYDPNGFGEIGSPVTLSYDGWSLFGGLYADPSGDLFLLVGRPNPNEQDDLDVVELRHYAADLQLAGTAHVKGGVSQGVKGIYTPFVASAADMLRIGNRLVVHMGRLIYQIAGIHHQVNLTFEVNVDTMVATTFEALGGYSYSSHSFGELLATDGTNLFMADHGDAFPRAIEVGVMAHYPTQHASTSYLVFPFDGAEGENFTGATLTGMVAGPTGAVVVGSSIQHPNAPNGVFGSASEHRNVYVATLAPTSGSHQLTWLTSFPASGGPAAGQPRIVTVAPDRHVVLFTVTDGSTTRVEYRLLDGSGAVLASTTISGTRFAPIGEPVLIDHTIYWVGRRSGFAATAETFLFALDVTTPSAPVVPI